MMPVSESEKSAHAFRTISEVSEELDVPQHVLRFWETRFAQVKPLKRGGNRRYYRPDDVNLLKTISHLHYVDGFTLKGVQKLLRDRGLKSLVAAFLAKEGDAPIIDPVEAKKPADHTDTSHGVENTDALPANGEKTPLAGATGEIVGSKVDEAKLTQILKELRDIRALYQDGV